MVPEVPLHLVVTELKSLINGIECVCRCSTQLGSRQLPLQSLSLIQVCPFKEVLYYFTMAARFDACYAYCRCTNEMECHKLNWLVSIHSTALHYNTYTILATQDEGC